MQWESLEAAVDKQAWGEALERAVEAWRRLPQPPLAALVDAIAEKIEAEPMPRGDAAAFHAEWLKRARVANAAQLGGLLESVTRSLPEPHEHYWREGTAKRRFKTWLERVGALAERPKDPRIAAALMELVRKAAFPVSFRVDVVTIWEPALAVLRETADARVLAPMRALVDKPIASRAVVREWYATALPAAIEAIEQRAKKQPKLSEADAAKCSELAAKLGGRAKPVADAPKQDEAQLFAQVVENVDDDGPREVIADFWMEHGDPRGQLVSLQLKSADDKTVRALLREHEKTWLGELSHVTKNRVWRRGFLDELVLLHNAAADPKVWKAAKASPLLGTVRTIHKGAANETHFADFVFSPTARSLREVTCVSRTMLNTLVQHDRVNAKHLVLDYVADKHAFAAIASAKNLAVVDTLTAGVKQPSYDKIFKLVVELTAKKPMQLVLMRPLRWYQNRGAVGAFLNAVRGELAHVPAVGIDFEDSHAIARRGKKGLLLELVVQHLYSVGEILPQLKDIERVLLRARPGAEMRDQRDHARDVLAAIPKTRLETDDAWAAVLAKR